MRTKAERIDLPDGAWRIGSEDAYLLFIPRPGSDRYDVWLGKSGETLLPSQKSITKGFKAFDNEGNMDPLISELRQFHLGAEPVLERIRNILAQVDDARSEREIDRFASALRAARRLRLYDGMPGSSIHQTFDDVLLRLATKLQRPPTKGELADEMCRGQREERVLKRKADGVISKLCKENGFDWLPNHPSGRPKSGKNR